ncbi:MAG: signal recognition particle protein, partial [Angelakisella sp.]
FYPDRMASRILGMGDMLSLIEKASGQMDDTKALSMAKKLQGGSLDFNDLLEQMGQMKKMGSISKLVDMLPGGGKVSEDDLQKGEQQMKRTEAIIHSMTPGERAKPTLIDPKRKRRIAAGSGTKVEDVNRLLRQLEDTRKMMKQMTGMKRRGKIPNGMLPMA